MPFLDRHGDFDAAADHLELPPAGWEPRPGDSAEEADRRWRAEVYRGDRMAQTTLRALLVGVLIGGFMSLSNLYVGLMTGWGLGASITAVILAYAFFSGYQRVAQGSAAFTVLENNTMQTTASASAYMSTAGLVSAVPALYMTTGAVLSGWELTAWMFAISLLGVALAIPMKRQLINVERLKFPEGIACAETLRSMHAHGDQARGQARALGLGGLVGGIATLLRDGWALIPSTFSLPGSLLGIPLSKLTLGAEGSSVMVAAGAIIGPRVGLSLLAGAIFSFGIAGPLLIERGVIDVSANQGPNYYRDIVGWTLWPGVMMMLTYSVAGLALQWRMILRAILGMGAAFRGASSGEDELEIPTSWFVIGVAISGTLAVILQITLFGIVWWTACLAVALTFLLCVVAARATGETAITPVGPMGKLTQLMFGGLAPANMTANLMAANVTAGAASQMGDLMNDLKTGYLVGGSPRRQLVAQLVGVVSGALFATPAYELLVVKRLEADPSILGSAAMPAPAAQVWARVARLLSEGLESIPPSALTAMAIAGALGVLFAILEAAAPRVRRFLPSVMGLGIACTVPFYNSFSMFLGSMIALGLSRRWPAASDRYTVVVASGLIAGETLVAVAIILYQVL